MGVSQFWAPYNKDHTIWGTLKGPYFRKLPERKQALKDSFGARVIRIGSVS